MIELNVEFELGKNIMDNLIITEKIPPLTAEEIAELDALDDREIDLYNKSISLFLSFPCLFWCLIMLSPCCCSIK